MAEQQSTNQNVETTSYSDDERDETISLCDCSSGQILLKSSTSSFSAGSDQEHYFEFCSQEWSNPSVSDECFPAENIVFFGKIITSDEPASQLINLQSLMSTKETRNGTRVAEYYSFRWDGSHNKTNPRKAEMSFMIKREDQKLRKVPVGKMRWSLFLLGGHGMRRFQTMMGLRDIKSRQSRLGLSSTLFRLDNDGGDKKMMISSNGISRNRRRQGLWGLLRAISCGGQQHSISSIGCIPRQY